MRGVLASSLAPFRTYRGRTHARPPSPPQNQPHAETGSFLALKGVFQLVDGLQPAQTPDAIGGSSSGGGAGSEPTGDEAAAAAGQEGGGGGPPNRRRRLDTGVGEGGMGEPWRLPERRSLSLLPPFEKTAGGQEKEDDRVQVVVGVALEVRYR